IKITFLNPDNSQTSIEKETTLFYLTSLPSQYGWYPGDGHMHTNWSDGSYSISQRKNQAYNTGLKWIIITDHASNDSNDLQQSEWGGYVYICNTVQDSSVTVCPGEELHTNDGFGNSHLLTYKNSLYVSSYGTCQELINRVKDNNGIPIIAHPYHILYPWNDWSASGFNGLEIISGQDGYSTQAVNRWDTILTTNLQNIISGSYPKIIGMANNDSHSIGYFGINMNYVYTGSQSPPGTNRNQVYNNLIAGRITASSDGSLAVFSLNGYAPGSIVNVTPGNNNITIVVNGESIYGYNTYYCLIRVIKNGTLILEDGFYDSKIVDKTYTFTAISDCYYRVEVIFYTLLNDQYIYSYCFVSPIYVNIP
ncbi:MAG: CehA/McbA family metallohydrolase, partial [Caldisericia bacterium]|nr:CehA/McbA family metallohydrolase [Caldisericia bacterium]